MTTDKGMTEGNSSLPLPGIGFTRGPWKAREGRVFVAPGGRMLATVHDFDGSCIPDSRLIAAAPDLYEALAQLLEIAESVPFDDHPINAARKALAKALTGGKE